MSEGGRLFVPGYLRARAYVACVCACVRARSRACTRGVSQIEIEKAREEITSYY